ncbi:MAG: LPS export ABC transporter periplasmic protein LptC [Chitinophagales bacterium]|nr:LPS export ABC transporter periplasmic protein LptC [Bacteroidota bacterium]MCB9043390.1 LPS export ABC transporter periplasmic protein LptC [Chitinophagales bacterium]
MKITNVWFLLICLFVVACENDMQKISALENVPNDKVETSYGLELLYSSQANVKVKIEAPLAQIYNIEQPYQEFPEGIKVTFYNDSSQVISFLTAKYAIRYERESKTLVRDSVWVRSVENNESLFTEEMTWDEKKHLIFTDKYVTIHTPTQKIFAQKGFESNENFTNYKLKGVQNSSLIVKENKTPPPVDDKLK